MILKRTYTSWIILIILVCFLMKPIFVMNLIEFDHTNFMVLISLMVLIPLVLNVKKYKIKFNNINYIIIAFTVIYFILRLAAVFYYGFDKSILISVYFELFMLVILNRISLAGLNDFDWVLKATVIIVFALNVMCLIIHTLYKLGAPEQISWLYDLIYEYTWYDTYNYAALYKNPNSAGLATGITLLMAAVCFKKKNAVFYLYVVFSVCYICITGCRSAQIALIAILLIWCAGKICGSIDHKKIVAVVLLLCIIANVGIMLIIKSNSDNIVNSTYSLNVTEQKMDLYSSGRYRIWKYNLSINEESISMGKGSALLQEDYKKEHLESLVNAGLVQEYYAEPLKKLVTHNGYFEMWFVCGLICALLFFMIILSKIWYCDRAHLKKYWSLLVFIFIINLFESMFLITSTYYFSMVMMIILSMPSKEVKRVICYEDKK